MTALFLAAVLIFGGLTWLGSRSVGKSLFAGLFFPICALLIAGLLVKADARYDLGFAMDVLPLFAVGLAIMAAIIGLVVRLAHG